MKFPAKRSGIDVVDFWHAIRMSAGNSFLWETCGPNVFRGEYHDSFPIDLMCKDTQLGYEMAKTAKVRYRHLFFPSHHFEQMSSQR